MLTHSEIAPGISLSCIQDHRFKHSAMTFQYLRPMCTEEAAMNALIPSVLLRGCKSAPDLRRITQRLDDLYGASVSPISRRAGNCQTAGLYLSLMDDRFAPEGEALTEQAIAFLKELLFDYPTEQGGFLPDFVEGEKTNQIYAIEAEYNDKQTYCTRQLLKSMCREDSFGVSRMGEPADVEAITPQDLLRHYEKVRRESPVEVLYVGSAAPERMEMLVRQLFAGEDRSPAPLNADAPLHLSAPEDLREPVYILRRMGADISIKEREKEIRLRMDQRPGPVSLCTGPYPGFPTDLQSVFLAAASVACGESRITETVFEARFAAAALLRQFGARIRTEGQTAVALGTYPLRPGIADAPDLRGGAALVLAGLAADGLSIIGSCRHIRRGYEDLCRDLGSLGAEICWL